MISQFTRSLARTAAVLALAALILTAACKTDEERIREQNDAADEDATVVREIVGRKSVSVFDLRAGDCFTEAIADETTEANEIDLVPCDGGEATARVTNLVKVESDAEDYPGEVYFDDQFVQNCDASATAMLWPTSESWDVGDRTITCVEEL